MAMEVLLKTDVGLMSLLTIVVVMAIGAYIGIFIRNRIREEERQKKA